jgi:hypothetical protein
MNVVDISQFDDSVVLHFETEGQKINAYTLASILVSLADAAKAANAQLNPGYEVEIVVEALGPGSFRAKIRAFYKKNRNLFSQHIVVALAVGIIGNYIYERTLAVDNNVKVEINTDEVVIQRGDEKIIVPRRVYDATRQVEKDPQFRSSISQVFETAKSDPKITGFGFVKNIDDPPPQVIVNREAFERLAVLPPPDTDKRVITEIVDLQIIKAILERSDRKWEFVWRGIKISSPIIDQAFYDKFIAHNITIAPGDVLRVKLAILQRREPKTGIFSNEGYEVVEVFEHVPRLQQPNLPDSN